MSHLRANTNDATVLWLSQNSDLSSSQSDEVDVGNATGRLMPGAYAFVHFKVQATNGAVTIPSNSLFFRTEGLRVGAVRNSHVTLLPITIGQDYGDRVEVFSGLTARDAVIVNPSDSLTNGAQAQVESKATNGVRQ